MSESRYQTLQFSVSGWYDQVQIGYTPKDGRLEEDQDGPGFKLFGYDSEGVLVECVCFLSDGGNDSRSTGSIYTDQAGTKELFGIYLPLSRASFEWLWATLARCQDCLSEIEVDVAYASEDRGNDSRTQSMLISGASFTLCTGEYFTDR